MATQNRVFLLFAILGLLGGCAAPPAPGAGESKRAISNGAKDHSASGSLSDLDTWWETDTGQRIKLADLNGRVRIVSMFYATCQGVCVITKQDMQAIEASLSPKTRERVGFVLVTLDARRDTAEALQAYRKTEGLATGRWTLLRGDEAATGKLAELLGIGSGRDASGRFVHSSELIVVDDSGRIIHHHSGLRADLGGIAHELEVAAFEGNQPPHLE
jgi:protein SCO1/2